MIRRLLLVISFLFAVIPTANAFSWADLWQTPNQQGASFFSKGKSLEAAELFTAPEWKGSAFYRVGQYDKAADAFRQANTALAHYNLGNTLAQVGDFKSAIAAYDQALSLDPAFEDAKFNRDLLEKLMKENPQAQKDQSQNSQQKNNPQESSQDNKSDQSKQNQQQAEQNQQQQQQQDQQQNQDKNQSAENSQKLPQDKKSEQPTAMAMAEQNSMQNQNEEQMLRRVPDEPGGLLRQKFLRDHERYEQKQYGG